MFEKFTQKAIDVIQAGQNYASEFGHKRVLACHILLGLVAQTKGVQAKILNFDKIHFEKLNSISHQTILNLTAELEIVGRPHCSELEHTHWAIKNINLVEVLENIGVNMLNF